MANHVARFGAGLLLISSSAAYSQTHPCDLIYPTSYQFPSTQSVRIGFCQAPMDEFGVPITIAGFKIQIMRANLPIEVRDVGPLTPLTGPNASGELLYQTEPLRFTGGLASLTVTAYSTTEESVASPPISLRITGPILPPKSLTIIRDHLLQ
jgi:hypothetical protein